MVFPQKSFYNRRLREVSWTWKARQTAPRGRAGLPAPESGLSSTSHTGCAESRPRWVRGKSMTDFALPGSIEPARRGPNLDHGINPLTAIIFMGVIAAGLL